MSFRPDKYQKTYIVGKGYVFDLGTLPPEKINMLMNLSEDSRQQYIQKLISSIPPVFGEWAGFCTKIRKYVKMLDCIRCAKNSGFTTVAEWSVCKDCYLSTNKEVIKNEQEKSDW